MHVKTYLLQLLCYCWVALDLRSLYFGFMLAHLGTICWCQSCSCWCSCCASGCSCFCSRCLRGCCAVEVVDVVGAVLCGASRNMLVCSVSRVPIRRATQKSDSSRFRVSGFGFRVSSIETNFRCRFRVSGFGFRRLKPTYSLSVSGFGFRVSSIETHFRCRFRVSGFGFRVSSLAKPTFAAGFGFRVSGFGFRRLKPTFAVGFGFRVSGFVA